MASGFFSVLPICLLTFLLSVTTSLAQNPSGKSPGQSTETEKQQKIHIMADQLITDINAQWSEFKGNVTATQGTAVIRADRLIVFFQKGTPETKDAKLKKKTLDRIEAYGHVRIKSGNRVAVSGKAVYLIKSGILILTGRNSTVKSGKNLIKGSKIKLYRNQERLEVDGRVRAIFSSNSED